MNYVNYYVHVFFFTYIFDYKLIDYKIDTGKLAKVLFTENYIDMAAKNSRNKTEVGIYKRKKNMIWKLKNDHEKK